jgi:hypothetical protein
MAVGDDRQLGANDGYLDVPAESYSWDTTVPNHGSLAPGDPIVLWDKRMLLGASLIERIDRGNASKPVYRCSICGGSNIKPRKTQTPPWRCFKKHLQNEGLCLLTCNLSAVSSTVGGHGGAVSL